MASPIRKPVLIALVAGLVIAAIPAGYFYMQYQTTQKRLANPNLAAQEEAKALVATIGKLMILPSETPTVATVQDREKLKDQAFFSHSENGDKVLIFTVAKKVILYRPRTHQIVDVAPINVNPLTSPTPGGPTPTPLAVRLSIRNGTNVTGLTRTYEQTLASKVKGLTIAERNNAQKRDYEKSLIVLINPAAKAQADAIAKAMNLTVGTLPEGEPKPTTDVLLILGADVQ